MRRLFALIFVLVITACAASASAAPAPSRAAAPCGGTKAAITHVVVIIEENHAYSQVVGQMPKLEALAKQCALFTHAQATTHPSLGNYMALTSGHAYFAGSDCTPKPGCTTTASSIFQQATTWRVYAQSMPSNCYLSNSGQYVPRHTAAPYYTAIRSECSNWQQPITKFTPAALPQFTLLIPDLAHDMHGSPISTGDTYAAGLINQITPTAEYQAGHVLIMVTFDEGKSSNQTIWTSAMAKGITPRVISAATNQYGLLHTWQDVLGLGCLQSSCSNPSQRTALGL